MIVKSKKYAASKTIIPRPAHMTCLELTEKYLNFGVSREKKRDDLRHIALAVIAECDYIVSWNFKHFVKIKTITKVQAVNKLLGYGEITILPPSMLLEGDEADD